MRASRRRHRRMLSAVPTCGTGAGDHVNLTATGYQDLLGATDSADTTVTGLLSAVR